MQRDITRNSTRPNNERRNDCDTDDARRDQCGNNFGRARNTTQGPSAELNAHTLVGRSDQGKREARTDGSNNQVAALGAERVTDDAARTKGRNRDGGGRRCAPTPLVANASDVPHAREDGGGCKRYSPSSAGDPSFR